MSDPIYPTRDEAIAVAIAESADGDTVFVHGEACPVDGAGNGCDCTPQIHYVRRGRS